MAHEVFITGATGFLGRRLLAEFLRETDCRFNLLIRSPCAQQLLTQHFPAAHLTRIRFVWGDVTLPELGLDDSTREGLERSVNEVWHLAAHTSFDESKRAETFRINVDGTRNLLGVVKRFAKLDVLYHISTAYVCGLKLGSIPEGSFLVSEGFKNPYEESKHESEGLVRSSGLPAAVIRPSITMGDSRTGDSGTDIRMYYGYAFALLRAAMHAFGSAADYWNYWRDDHVDGHRAAPNVNARLVGCAETLKNLVTVDDVVAVCLAIRAKEAATNKTFNLVNSNNLTIGDALEAIQRILKVSGYCYDPSLTRATLRDEAVERAAFRYTRMYWPYALNTEPRWETGNVDALSVPRVAMTPALFELLISSFMSALSSKEPCHS